MDHNAHFLNLATTALIPTNGVHVTEAYYPAGFYVAKYDENGFTTAPRWFATREQADAYACNPSPTHHLPS